MAFQLNNIPKPHKSLKPEGNTEPVSLLKKEITLFNRPFTNKAKEDFFTELGVLLKAGVPLKDGLELIKRSQKKRQDKAILGTVTEAIISGQALSDALRSHKCFTTYEYHSINIGEETGTLARVSEQLGRFFARKNEQRRDLVGALTYPVIILSTAVLVVAFMLGYVVPMFQDIFKQQGVELPGITRSIIAASGLMQDYGPLMLGALIIFLASRPLLKKKKRFKQLKDALVLKLPYIGSFVKRVYLSQFTQAVALLTASKVPVVNSIQMVGQMIDFYPLQDALGTVERHILKGEPLSKSMEQHGLFDDKMIALVKVAEETNQTEYVFERLNAQYDAQVRQQSKMLSTVMEPFIILVVGVLVGIILIAMYLPMFRLSSVMG